ncbi:TA system VapC family ribonuclease toxin [Glycomyces arizonensis]|uniref:TA system VapC family ribonuclease toxin n=1 Tax=Glycomyces arizonensis TaxID=256035 RepID=UPI0003FB7F59|nr:TA system VapC family ribonuclease toxin [Glycomyces arizonensis]
MAALLDLNVLIALAFPEHVHNKDASEWLTSNKEDGFAVCPITEGGLVRFLLRQGASAAIARQGLSDISAVPGYEFWPDDLPYSAVSLTGVVGHRQVTDAYLAGLARARNGKLATFDSGLSSLHSDVAVLIPKG